MHDDRADDMRRAARIVDAHRAARAEHAAFDGEERRDLLEHVPRADASSEVGTALRSSGRLNAKRLTRRPSGPNSSTDDVIGYVARPVRRHTWKARSVTASDPTGPGGTDTRSVRPGNISICSRLCCISDWIVCRWLSACGP